MEIAQKSTLAKLLATENVSVEHQKVQTAYFDLKNRKIVLPIWEKMSNELYNLLIGHEVGHALNTPFEGWHERVSNKGSGFKSFLNVIEDARIERMQKKQYPGLVKDFYAGYRELFERDFFGVKNMDVQELPLIDRINLHFKIGNMLGITFTDTEQVFVDKVSKVETWDEVLALAEELYGYSEEETAMQEMIEENFFSDDEEMESPEMDSVDNGDGDSDEFDENEEGSEGEGSQDENEEQSSDSETSNKSQDVEGPVSFTDKNFRKNEETLTNKKARPNLYVKFPTNLKADKIIMPLNKVWDTNFEDIFYVNMPRWSEPEKNVFLDIQKFGDELYTKFMAKNNSYINMLAQQFEMRRTASQLARSRTHKTGELNMNKLWATRLTEDVFLSTTVVPNGKNHGMVMFIDFSGSMARNMTATLEQLLIQISFCKKVNIPFDVYGFTTNHNLEDRTEFFGSPSYDELTINPHTGTQITHLISSSVGSAKYKTIFKKMLVLSKAYCEYGYGRNAHEAMKKDIGCEYVNYHNLPSHFNLGSTPLAETALVARDLVKNFKQKNRVEIMNVIFLTDGDPTSELMKYGPESNYAGTHLHGIGNVVITERGVTTVYPNEYRYSAVVWYRAVLKHIKNTLDVRLINFHIGDFKKRDLCYQATDGNYFSDWDSNLKFEAQYKKEWLANKFMEFENNKGFDVRYLIQDGTNLQVDVEEMEVKSENKGDLLRGFRKFQKNKASNRVFLNKFIDKVA